MRATKRVILLAAFLSVLAPAAALANMSYSPWVHEVIQSGADAEVTVSIFDQTTETNSLGDPLPGFEAAYTLKRWGWDSDDDYSGFVFKDRIFTPQEADEVTEYTCHHRDFEYEEPDCAYQDCTDCDGDGVGDCVGFCGVAYRYKIIDICPPPGKTDYYEMSTTPPYNYFADEGLGFTNAYLEDIGAECQQEDDGGCSVSNAARINPNPSFLLTAMIIALEEILGF